LDVIIISGPRDLYSFRALFRVIYFVNRILILMCFPWPLPTQPDGISRHRDPTHPPILSTKRSSLRKGSLIRRKSAIRDFMWEGEGRAWNKSDVYLTTMRLWVYLWRPLQAAVIERRRTVVRSESRFIYYYNRHT